MTRSLNPLTSLRKTRWQEYSDYCINEYIAAGFYLFPCDMEKRPLYKGWQDVPYEPLLTSQDLLVVGGCYGIALKSDDLVLDVDPRRYKDGINQLQEFCKLLDLKDLGKTFTVRTARGGFHIYFKKPVDFPIRRMYMPQFNAIEIKSKGRYVIGAGSVWQARDWDKAKPYTIMCGKPSEIMELSL